MTMKLLKDKYRLLEKIDEDEKVVLFLGQTVQDPVMNVDIRVLKRRFMTPEFVRRYTEEFQAMSALDSPQFMKVYDIDFFNNLYYVATEHVEGKTIRSIMENRERLSLAQAINVVTQVARALGHAYKENMKYRALTYSDIVVTESGKIKILQFRVPRNVTSNPESGGKGQTASADVFFAGCLFYELLTLEGINVKNSALHRIRSIKDFYFEPGLAKLKPAQIENIKGIIYKCVTGEIPARFQSIDELLSALVHFVQDQVNTTDILTTMQVEPSKFAKKEKQARDRGQKAPVILKAGQEAPGAAAPRGDAYDILFGRAPVQPAREPASRDLRASAKVSFAAPPKADQDECQEVAPEAVDAGQAPDEIQVAGEEVTMWQGKKSHSGGLLAKMASFWYTTLFMIIGVLSFALYIFW